MKNIYLVFFLGFIVSLTNQVHLRHLTTLQQVTDTVVRIYTGKISPDQRTIQQIVKVLNSKADATAVRNLANLIEGKLTANNGDLAKVIASGLKEPFGQILLWGLGFGEQKQKKILRKWFLQPEKLFGHGEKSRASPTSLPDFSDNDANQWIKLIQKPQKTAEDVKNVIAILKLPKPQQLQSHFHEFHQDFLSDQGYKALTNSVLNVHAAKDNDFGKKLKFKLNLPPNVSKVINAALNQFLDQSGKKQLNNVKKRFFNRIKTRFIKANLHKSG